MKTEDTTNKRTCSRCKAVVMTFSEIVYSQGKKVCLDCKKKTQGSDDLAFDRYINGRH